MLNITRRIGEAVWLNGSRLEVKRGKGNRIVLSIDAPQDVHVVREELLEHDADSPYGVKKPEARVTR